MSNAHRSRRPRPAAIIAALVGVLAVVGAGTALAETPAAQAFREQPLVPGTPCTVTATACVDLDSQRSWLFENGRILRGPVPAATGGQGMLTPVGHSLRVYRKEAHHESGEFKDKHGRPAPMPWAVFFQDGGIAFHEGNTETPSGGCVRLARPDARAWFDHLQIGDQVQVVSARQVAADRAT